MNGAVYTGPVRNLGDDAFTDWEASVKALGGVPTVWPFRDSNYGQYNGQAAARFTAAQYGPLVNAGRIDLARPQSTAPSGPASNAFFWVLAPADAIAAQPPSHLTTWQSVENAVFTTGDAAATAVGLPSLASLEAGLQKLLFIVALVGIGLYVVTHHGGSKRWE